MKKLAAGFLMVLLALALSAQAAASQIPQQANKYKRDLVRAVQQEFGLDGPVALHAAQIHQESTWRADVDSPVGAQGLAQFMPDTSSWISEIYPGLGAAAPYSPGWAMQAMVRYNRWHNQRIEAADACHLWAMSMSAYNGGLGWVNRDKRLAAEAGKDPEKWWFNVEHHTSRANWAEQENRHYVRRIIQDLEPAYIRSGWPGRRTCP